jgi:hypothetical protein
MANFIKSDYEPAINLDNVNLIWTNIERDVYNINFEFINEKKISWHFASRKQREEIFEQIIITKLKAKQMNEQILEDGS